MGAYRSHPARPHEPPRGERRGRTKKKLSVTAQPRQATNPASHARNTAVIDDSNRVVPSKPRSNPAGAANVTPAGNTFPATSKPGAADTDATKPVAAPHVAVEFVAPTPSTKSRPEPAGTATDGNGKAAVVSDTAAVVAVTTEDGDPDNTMHTHDHTPAVTADNANDDDPGSGDTRASNNRRDDTESISVNDPPDEPYGAASV